MPLVGMVVVVVVVVVMLMTGTPPMEATTLLAQHGPRTC
jgi:hypothetical protein